MESSYLIGRFIPVAPGWTVVAWVSGDGDVGQDIYDLVGWFLCEGDKCPDFWAPAVWEDGKLEPVYPRRAEAYVIDSVNVYRTESM